MIQQHGYGPYTQGCRCEVCRQAKAAYMQSKRARARSARTASPSDAVFIADVRAHGISAYQDQQCRCGPCLLAKSEAGKRETRRSA